MAGVSVIERTDARRRLCYIFSVVSLLKIHPLCDFLPDGQRRSWSIEGSVHMFQIRPLALDTFEQVCADMPLRSRAQHWSNFTRQQSGELLYLIAWDGAHAIGQVCLFWRPSNDPVAMLTGCPWVIDLLVHPDYRSRGAGTQLLNACESAARSRMRFRIGLGVAVGNTRARALYERLGYADAGLGEQVMTGSWEDASGQTHIWEDTVVYLIKQLAS